MSVAYIGCTQEVLISDGAPFILPKLTEVCFLSLQRKYCGYGRHWSMMINCHFVVKRICDFALLNMCMHGFIQFIQKGEKWEGSSMSCACCQGGSPVCNRKLGRKWSVAPVLDDVLGRHLMMSMFLSMALLLQGSTQSNTTEF